MYKVARYFYHSADHTIGTYDAAMEVFSIGQDTFWRETSEVPPYPVCSVKNPIHSKGYLFWNIDERFLKGGPHGFLCFSLEDETSSLIPHPCPYLPSGHALFPSDYNPFYAGFGNRDTDELSYKKMGIPKGKIFIINPKGEIAINSSVDVKSYTSLHTLIHDMFPPNTLVEQEDYNSWNYWKMPLPDVDL